VNEIIAGQGSGEAVIGPNETLHRLQQGQVQELVAAWGLKGSVERCTKCGWVDRSGASPRPLCGSREKRELCVHSFRNSPVSIRFLWKL